MDKQNYRFCIGSVLILAAAVLGIISPLISFLPAIISMGSGAASSGMITAMLTNIGTTLLTSLPIILLAVMLMLKKRSIVITILSAIMLVMTVISLVATFITIHQTEIATVYNVNWFGNVVLAVTYALLLALSITTMNPQPNGFKKLWFLPGVCYGIFAVSAIIFSVNTVLTAAGDMYLNSGTKIAMIIGSIIPHIPTKALYTAGYFLAGHWLANPYKKGYQPQQQYAQPQYAQYQQPQQYQPYAQPQQPQYDEQTMQALNYYKWQYESGAITWEQYNACVQQYLGK